MAHDFFKVPNLISVGRLLFLIPAAYFIAQPDPAAKFWALLFLFIAAVSDFLDGFFARRLNQQTELGLLLDPLADKVMAATLVILLLLFRDLPLWLAAIIVGRDLIIALGGLAVKSKIAEPPKSNLTGKYCFAAVAVVLLSYVIEFEFGIRLITPFVVVLSLLSLIQYGRIFYLVAKGHPLPCFEDRRGYRIARIIATWCVSIYFLYHFFGWLGWW
jgi:CDP-diacylglycerol--glycerol-3-phosphate 3-phosphatidyltransferase